MSPPATSGINPPFGGLSPSLGQVAYVLLNRLPLNKRQVSCPARLAYIRHAASVRPEPGSNSPSDLDPGASARFVADRASAAEKRVLASRSFHPETRSRPAPSVSLFPTVQFSRIGPPLRRRSPRSRPRVRLVDRFSSLALPRMSRDTAASTEALFQGRLASVSIPRPFSL